MIMATIKSYTDVSQSKKLAEILPIESADMGWNVFVDDTTRILPINDWNLVKDGSGNVKFYHAWSLAALIDIIPQGQVNRMCNSDKWEASSWNNSDYEPQLYVDGYDNPVDACVAMIEKLHELNLL